MPVHRGHATNTVFLQDIPFGFDPGRLRGQMCVPGSGRLGDAFDGLCKTAMAVGRPRAIFRTAYIEEKGDCHVVVDGVRLESRVLRVNLERAHRVFPFVVTCGVELDRWAGGFRDILHRYWAEAIKEKAMRTALAVLKEHIARQAHPGKMATMTPRLHR